MAQKNVLQPAAAVQADIRSLEPLTDADVQRALRLGYKEAWQGSDGLWYVSMVGTGSMRLALLENRLVPVLRERSEDGIALIRPVVFEGITIRPIDGRMVQVAHGSESHIVAVDRWLRRLQSRLPRTIRTRMGMPLVAATETAISAARELRARET